MELVQDKAKEAAEWVLRLHENNYSDDVVKSWLEWMEMSEFNADEYEKQLLAWEMSNALDTEVCSLLAKEQECVSQKKNTSSLRFMSTSLASAAAFICICVLYFFNSQNRESFDTNNYATTIGESKVIQLQDGSSIHMGGKTSVTVKYTKDFREVYLISGEALFDVKKEVSRPFNVKTSHGNVKVIGTRFNIRSRKSADIVTVARGIVAVSNDVNTVAKNSMKKTAIEGALLTAGEQIEISSSLSQKINVDIQSETAWQSGVINYKNATIAEMIEDLNRYYDGKILVDDPIVNTMTFSGVIQLSLIEEWFETLPLILNVEVDSQYQLIILKTGNKGEKNVF